MVKDDFPSTLTRIGKYGMSGMGLTSLEIPRTITKLVHGAFSSLDSLTYLYIPSSIATIPEFCFASADKVTKIEIEDGVKEIKENAFAMLAHYDLDGVRHGGNYGFEIHIPESVTSIDWGAIATGDTYGPVTVYGKAGSYVEKWVTDVNTQPEVSFVAK